ncbi:MAG: winged helix-turn-helix domain-containing protein [Candidatus Methanomethylophilaceae archaeon]|jgi:predicted ArsR family transcriptional regulator|nr:winged helix-turn-helix domain-containing protein [Candidatus Methanomethylophilaceae archaeon]
MSPRNECGVLAKDRFELYLVNERAVACWGDSALAILASLKKGMMTQRGLSRELGIPVSTISKHVHILEDNGILSVTENKNDKNKRKKYYRLSAEKLMSFGPGDREKDDRAMDMLLAMKGRPELALASMLSWTLLKGESRGVDFNYFMEKLGSDLYKAYTKELVGRTGEETVANLSRMLVDTGIMNGLEVLTYLPVTFHGWYTLPRRTYPAHITKSMFISLVKSTIEGFYGRTMSLSDVKYWEDETDVHVVLVLE